MLNNPEGAIPASQSKGIGGIAGFARHVLRYFQDFIETDFHRQQAPRRRIILKNDVGFRMGVPLRKYPSFFDAIWKACREPLSSPFELRIAKGRFTSPLSPTLRDLIRQQVEAIPDSEFEPIKITIVDYAVKNRVAGSKNAEKFSDDISIQFVEEVGRRIVTRLLSFLEEPFKQNAYSAIESVYDVEADLTDAITASAIEQFSQALNTLITSGDSTPLAAVFDEFFAASDVKRSLTLFFEEFSTADVFLELRDLDNTLRTAENQSLYLYMGDIRYGTTSFPIFYIPLEIRFDEHATAFVLTADPHLYVNKRALDWIVQEISSQTGRTFVSPVLDRILYLSETDSFANAAIKLLKSMIPALDIAADLDLMSNTLQRVDNASLRMSNSLYFAVFDRADESILSDYEALLTAVEQDGVLAQSMFENIVRSMILEEPRNCMPTVEKVWGEIPTPDRLVASSPIPVNEEQRKIQIALQTPDCRYIIVQGPPGTGKSHTITALAFDAILNGKNILILSDKQEALDVVEDKLAKTLEKVRHGSTDFPNPILRLGKTSSYPRLIASASLERIKEHDKAQKANAAYLDNETKEVYSGLRSNVENTISAYSSIRLTEISELSQLEIKIEKTSSGLSKKLREPKNSESVGALDKALTQMNDETTINILSIIPDAWQSPVDLLEQLTLLRATQQLIAQGHRHAGLELFSELTPNQIAPLSQCIQEYEQARWPVLGFLFTGGRVRATTQKLTSALPCTNPLDLHKKVASLRAVVNTLSAIQKVAGDYQLAEASLSTVYRRLASSATIPSAVHPAHQFIASYINAFEDLWPQQGQMATLSEVLHFVLDSARYATLWHRLSGTIGSAPSFDYVGEKSRLETLYASRMSREIDHKFIEFVGENRALARSIGEVIKAKKQFPTQEFERFGQAFPCIIAGIREYAQYVPLKNQCFDVVVIDEASQVSLAQAFPALLRAKSVVVFGDERQFSNVKSMQASNVRNATYLTHLEAYFRRNISDAADRIERLKQFDVKKSVLDFFKLIANVEIMLKKHFRGYQELISFSSEQFYGGQLQAIKIRARPLTEVIRFKVLEHDGRPEKHRNSNSVEAEFILNELRRMVDEGDEVSVGIITPFREQQEALSRLLLNDAYADQFIRILRLKIMTFDTCQGEERDLIIYSLVATRSHDALNYVFPVSLEQEEKDRIEEALKVQRLNVGFSRAKEGMLFVLSKPPEEYRGSIGLAIRHFQTVLERRSQPTGGLSESPMEAKVLDWIQKTVFFQNNAEDIELQTQFPIGNYLRQLDPTYQHPGYRCDFLLTYFGDEVEVRIIIEYDGFAEHFVNQEKVTFYNWEQFYRPEDIEREFVIESYGYKFLRINRFNLGSDPIQILSDRLVQLVQQTSQNIPLRSVNKIREQAAQLANGESKTCPKCGSILPMKDFFDGSLAGGRGATGRVCMSCKQTNSEPKPTRRRRYGRRW